MTKAAELSYPTGYGGLSLALAQLAQEARSRSDRAQVKHDSHVTISDISCSISILTADSHNRLSKLLFSALHEYSYNVTIRRMRILHFELKNGSLKTGTFLIGQKKMSLAS